MSKNKSDNAESIPERLYFQLFMAHQRNLYAFILASVHNISDAEDILQETATGMWRRFGEFTPGTSFEAWGITIARNLILKFFNEHKRSRLQFDSELLSELEDIALVQAGRIDALKEAITECMQRLNESNRKILGLRYEDGMTIKYIANLTGRSIEGMYKFFSRLQDSLLDCIENRVEHEGKV